MAGRRRKADEITTEEKKVVKKETKEIAIPRSEVMKRVDKTTEVLILNNTVGRVFFECTNGEELDIRYGGDTTVLSVEALQQIKNRAKSLFSRFYIVPVEVVSEGEATLEDVIVYLGLTNLYDRDNIKMEEYIDKIMDSKADVFEKYLDMISKDLIGRIAEKAIDLFEEGEFDSVRKQTALCNKLGNESLFEKI